MYALSGRLGSPLAARAAFARAFLPRLDPLRACFSPRGPPSPSPLPSSLLPPPLPSSSSEALAAPPSYDSSSLESSWRYLLGFGVGVGVGFGFELGVGSGSGLGLGVGVGVGSGGEGEDQG